MQKIGCSSLIDCCGFFVCQIPEKWQFMVIRNRVGKVNEYDTDEKEDPADEDI